MSPNGTITRTVYDGLGRAVSVWVGTDDAGATNDDPAGPGGNANNMVKVVDYVYDDGVVGDGNLTREIQYPDSNPDHDRVTDYAYDWRDRLVAVKSGVQATEDTTTHRPIFVYTLDNLGEVTVDSQYDGDGVTLSTSAPDPPCSAPDGHGV